MSNVQEIGDVHTTFLWNDAVYDKIMRLHSSGRGATHWLCHFSLMNSSTVRCFETLGMRDVYATLGSVWRAPLFQRVKNSCLVSPGFTFVRIILFLYQIAFLGA